MKRYLLILLGAAAITSGCGGGGGGDEALDLAWQLFERGSYDSAYIAFSLLEQREGEAAYEGLGWTTFKMNQDSLDAADRFFDLALNANSIDTYAGAAFVKLHTGDFQASVDNAELALTADSNYVFIHDNSVTDHDLSLYAAYGYFHLGDYAACITKIQKLDLLFSASPTDPDIETILLTKLESLR